MDSENAAAVQSRTRLVVIAIWAVIVLEIVTVFGQLAEFSGTVDLATGEDPLTLFVALSYMAYLVAMLICIVLVCMWIHRAHSNLHRIAALRAELLALPEVKRCVDDARPYRPFFPYGAPDRD